MWRGAGNSRLRVWFAGCLAVLLVAGGAGAGAAEYPRRIAIAPFSVLTPQEDLSRIAPLLPRLLSSRLMALTGAEVLLLPAGEGSPGQAAANAGYPLLLSGSVAKLGAGYSIDATAADLAENRSAGAFFAAAETIDEIIPRLGDLAADISEKLFGVKAPVRVPPAPQTQAPQPATQAAQAPAASVPVSPQAVTPGAAQPVPPAASAVPSTPEQGWTPSSLEKIGQSDKIADELYGVVTGDIDRDGNGEVIAWGKNILYIYRVKGTEVVPFSRITKGLSHHILNVDAADLDGDGSRELLVTDLVSDTLQSFLLKKQGEVYREIEEKIPYFLVALPGREGKREVLGQHAGFESPFQGKIYRMEWDGKHLVAADPLPLDTSISPLDQGILGLSSARLGEKWTYVYTDASSYLRVLDESGRSEYKSRNQYGIPFDQFEWGLYQPLEGRRKQYPLRRAARSGILADGTWILIPTAKSGLFSKTLQSYEEAHVSLLRWDGGEFVEKAGSQQSDRFHSGADFLLSSGNGKGSKVIASVVEQSGSAFKEKISRLLLFDFR